tara:strand:- start:291 stop:854 length:564 start_codon:yes stop_codon:yes gene_type:complete
MTIANINNGELGSSVRGKLNATKTLAEKCTQTYWFDANDAATSTTPITHGAGSTTTFLTNDAAGSGTTSYNPDSKTALWNTSTNKFDFTSLKHGDTVEFRVDIKIANAAAQEINLVIDLAEGTSGAYSLNVNHTYFKTASSGDQITAMFRIYMGDEDTRTGTARFRLTSIAATTIVVNGWFYQITDV